MDIHKPKPWHGWREFLKEYVIIVIGVLTALGAEQTVEWLHWRHVVGEARHELRLDQMRLLGRLGDRQGYSPCLARRLDELSAVLDEAEKTGRLPPVGEISGSGQVPWSLRSWSNIVSGGVLPRFPREEADRYSAEALYLESMPAKEAVEGDAWLSLRTMMGAGRPISTGELVSLRASLAQAYRQAGNIRNNVNQMAELARETGLLSDKEFHDAWRYGVDIGSRRSGCQPLARTAADPFAIYRKRATAPVELPKGCYDDPVRPYATLRSN